MANVLFKRGLQQSLPREGYAVDGVFYLTTDTHRLYVGQDTNPVLLNQTVNFVNSVSELEEKAALWKREGSEAAHAQDLYYILPNGGGENTHGGNILAVWCKDANNQYAWVQINPDHNTFLTDAQILVSAINNGANVKTTMTMSNGDSLPVDFNVKGSGNTIDIDVDADQNIVVKGDTYTLSRPTTGEIKLTSALGQDASSVKIVSGDNVTIADGTAAGDIKISAKDTVNTEASLTLDAAGKLTMQVTDSNADVVTASTDAITMKYGATGSLSAPIGGTLEVYSRSEVDEKFKDLNGLTYVGTVGDNGQYLMGNDYKVYNGSTAIDVHNGDMFLVAGSDVAYAADAKANTGDILIATGTETNGVLSSITWTFIPAGDDAKLDTTYNFDGNAAENSMTIRSISSLEGEQGVVGKIAFTAGEATAISSQVSGNTTDKNEILKMAGKPVEPTLEEIGLQR